MAYGTLAFHTIRNRILVNFPLELWTEPSCTFICDIARPFLLHSSLPHSSSILGHLRTGPVRVSSKTQVTGLGNLLKNLGGVSIDLAYEEKKLQAHLCLKPYPFPS